MTFESNTRLPQPIKLFWEREGFKFASQTLALKSQACDGARGRALVVNRWFCSVRGPTSRT